MVHSLRVRLVFGLLLIPLVSFPFLASAQEATTTATIATSTATTTINDGSTDAPVVRQERVRGWRRQSSEVQQKINALSTTAVQAISMPILFGVAPKDMDPNFGDPRDGGARTHQGEDIMAVKGTPIVSPTEAVVLRAVTGSSEGNTVYTANPGGETFVYMHLDRFGEGVTTGTVLKPGSLIGYVGNTGNASGGAAHLHFEVHANGGAALDPFPRLTAEFTAEQKISFLSTILSLATNPATLAQLLVSNFRSVFVADGSLGITLPPLIVEAFASGPAGVPQTIPLPAGDLEIESTGAGVVKLQTFLINKAVGPAAVRLSNSGATGYFGPITRAALVEYQLSVGVTPANGYYGPTTRALVEASGTVPTPTPGATSTPTTPQTSATFTRDLEVGYQGADVKALQVFLNSHGFVLATEGPGSVGQETDRFGALTRAALVRYQTSKNISPAIGYFGPITRASVLAAL